MVTKRGCPLCETPWLEFDGIAGCLFCGTAEHHLVDRSWVGGEQEEQAIEESISDDALARADLSEAGDVFVSKGKAHNLPIERLQFGRDIGLTVT